MAGRAREDAIQQDIEDLHGLGYAQELLRAWAGSATSRSASRSSRS